MDGAVAEQQTCLHCGSFMSPTSVDDRFCCQGCEFVFNFIQSQGLAKFYELRDSDPPSCPIPARTTRTSFAMFDDPEFVGRYSHNGETLRFYVEGLNCTACLWLIEKLPHFCGDAVWCRVNMGDSTVEAKRRPDGSFAAIAESMARLGLKVHPLRQGGAADEFARRENRRDLIRLGLAGAATGNIMILAVSLYGGATGALADQFRWLSALIAFPVLTFCAWPFYRNTFFSLRSLRLNLDVPIVAAILAGVIVSAWSLFSGYGDVYFDSLSMLVFLLLSSRFFLKRVQTRHLQPNGLEEDLLLATATRIKSSGEVEAISSMSIQVGDRLSIDGETMLPADGVVLTGFGVVDVSILTGESNPVDVAGGAEVSAGMRNIAGKWVLLVEKPPAQTRLAQILRDTEKSAASKSDFLKFSDTVSHWFIALVFAAAVGLVVYFASTDLREGVMRALALVIVTCPCVFGMAIPLSMSFAIRAGARNGLVIKNSNAIERLWSVESIYFDKTGTLTTGEMSVRRMSADDPEVLGLAAALEKDQPHPVAKAIVRALSQWPYRRKTVRQVVAIPGGGVIGWRNGDEVALKPMDRLATGLDTSSLHSQYALFINGSERAQFEIGDQPRAEAKGVLDWFRDNQFDVQMLSGDQSSAVMRCGQLLGYASEKLHAAASPEEKAKILRANQRNSAMVGDGANDAAALAASAVGIAMCGSLEASLRSADVYLIKPNLNAVVDLFKIARKTKIAIYRNLAFSVSFNLVSGALAVSGLMTPLWAAVLMPVSSLTILLSALSTGKSLVRQKERS